MLRWCGVAFDLLLLGTVGCGGPGPKRELVNPDPSGKIPAIKDSVERGDISAARQLVRDLDSDDPAVRFYAIQGLQRLTGESFGYQYFDDERARQPAVEKWKAWLRGWEAGQQHRGSR